MSLSTGSDLVELVGLITCVEVALCQITKLLVLVRRCARPALLRQESTARTCGRESRERERESYGDSTRRVRNEKGEGQMERHDTYAKNLFGALDRCVYVHTHEDVRMCADKTVQQKNVRATGERVHTSVVHTVIATTCVRSPERPCRKKRYQEKK